MTTHAERILEYVLSICTPAATGCVTVNRNFPFTVTPPAMPLLSINQVSDKPVSDEGPADLIFNDWYLQAEFLIALKSTTIPVDTQLNQIRANIHAALFADYTQAGLCVDTRADECTLELIDGQKADEPVAVAHCLYTFMYRTKISDITY